MEIKKIEGIQTNKIFLYALSTCVWCKKMKRFLKEIKVAYEYIDVDLLEGDEKKKIKNEMKKWNPSGSFPTIVIDDKECVIGFEPDELKEKINL